MAISSQPLKHSRKGSKLDIFECREYDKPDNRAKGAQLIMLIPINLLQMILLVGGLNNYLQKRRSSALGLIDAVQLAATSKENLRKGYWKNTENFYNFYVMIRK